MTEIKKSLAASYGLLSLGAVSLILLFALRSRIWEFMDPFPRVLFFFLWLMAPTVLLAANTFVIERWIYCGQSGGLFISGALAFLASGALIYLRVLLLPDGRVMEANLVFLTGPLYHLAAAVFVTGGYLVRSAQIIFRRREDRHFPASR